SDTDGNNEPPIGLRLCCFGLSVSSPALSLSKGWLTGSTRFACSRQACIENPYLPENPTKPKHSSLPSVPARRSLGEGGANSADSEDSGAFCLPKVKSLSLPRFSRFNCGFSYPAFTRTFAA